MVEGTQSREASPPEEPAVAAQEQHMQISAADEERPRSDPAAYDDSNPLPQTFQELVSHDLLLPSPPLSFLPPQTQTDQDSIERPQSQQGPSDGVMDICPNGLFTNRFASGTVTPNGIFGFGVETDLDFSAIDLSFLGSYNTQVPFEMEPQERSLMRHGTHSINQASPQSVLDGDSTTPSNISHHSIWRFVPAPGNHAFSDQANLSLPDHNHLAQSPESFVDVSKRATAEKLDSATRDAILAIVLSQIKSQTFPVVSAFPSVELLDHLIQFYLAGPFSKQNTWIHTASFRAKKAQPELLLAMAAAGAVLTPDCSLRKLGFAIQEIIRTHVPIIWEADNTKVRNLEFQQAFLLQLEIGLWSGSSRKIEISESFQQPLLTMLRRAGRFRRSSYSVINVAEDEDAVTLDQKWRAWVEQESYKRLVYHLLGHDAQSSIFLVVSPLMSYAELSLPLPESQELWTASSARVWKSLYRARYKDTQIRIPSLSDCIADIRLLEPGRAVINLELSCSAFLYAMWGMVWEYRQLCLLFRGGTSVWDSGVAVMTRYQELMKIFEYYRIHYNERSKLLFEVIMMHLHMSLEDIKLFAGSEGVEEAYLMHASIREWASSKTSRQAVWHAGQLVRAARALAPSHLRGFNAISLLHASLTLWTYGVASRMFRTGGWPHPSVKSTQSSTTPQQQTILLDDEESPATYRFISLDWGVPALRRLRPDTPVTFLDDPKAIMQLIAETMEAGDGEGLRPNSPLVESLSAVMRRLQETNFGEDGGGYRERM
ncbi:hypothetical protein LTS18_013072 [Coniosporium uncinatum]|uniref:Uncharacterized protein n=1 Tax=Coniosporium uncinatum TaxID=93489 RepID=A0ACC3DZ87_9PEZI|nr:hypothetical protein LTS18_013072 [Coniosporium uncinatum]